jgi:hypothetical protein
VGSDGSNHEKVEWPVMTCLFLGDSPFLVVTDTMAHVYVFFVTASSCHQVTITVTITITTTITIINHHHHQTSPSQFIDPYDSSM